MSREHNESLERVGAAIVEQLGSDDPLEREKLVSAISLGQRIAEYLQCEVADEGSWVDTGSDGSGYDCHVTWKGREYNVSVSAGHTDAEMDEWEAGLSVEATAWDALMDRVIAALGPVDEALAAELAAQVGRHTSDAP